MEILYYVGGMIVFFLFGAGAARIADTLCKSIFSLEAYGVVNDLILGGSFAIGLTVFLFLADWVETKIGQRKPERVGDAEAVKASPQQESIVKEHLRLFRRYVLPIVAMVLAGSLAFASVFTWREDHISAGIAAAAAAAIVLVAMVIFSRRKKARRLQESEE
ncbi:MAG: hypothetical protein PWQ57_1583 [Desulfovibrionales bacterium]|nr:hypothetical protein [Desulfovibrionales bacterium]